MSWWVNSWISVELQLCCCRNKSRVSLPLACPEIYRLGKIWFAHARSCQACTSLFWSCLGFAVLKNNLSLLKGLELTPPSSAINRTNEDDTRYYVYTYLVRIRTFSKNDFPFDEIYRRLLFSLSGHLSTTAGSPFLCCFTMSWWVNSWISVELELCCCRNKSRVRASH